MHATKDKVRILTDRTTATPSELLGIYLNDHLAATTHGMELAARLARAHRGSEEGDALGRIATEAAEDRAALMDLMAALDIPVQRYKIAMGWVVEKAGRLKPNGRLLERSPLSSLEELEIMRMGVEGKAACWRTLRLVADRDQRVGRARLDDLISRAKRQTDMLEDLRARAAEDLVDRALADVQMS